MQPIYTPGSSFLHQLYPLTKFILVVLLTITTYVFANSYLLFGVCCVVVTLAFSARVLASLLRTTVFILAPIAFSLTLIQGLLFPIAKTIPIVIGPVTLWGDGLLFALIGIVRIFALISTIVLLLKTTHPADLIYTLTARGLPQSVGYIILVALQLVPDMSARATAILEVQRSRGLETDGFIRRIRALVPLVVPLVVGAIADVEERAMALESRAFTLNGPKTALRVLVDTPPQRVARAVLLLLAAALVVARFTVLRGAL